MEIKQIELLGQTQTEEQKKQQQKKIIKLMLNPTQEAEQALIGASSCQHLFKYVSPIEQEIEQQREEREKQEQLFRQSLEYQQWQRENHKQIRINEQVEAMRKFEAEKQQVNVDAGKGSNAGTEPKLLNQFDNEFKFSGLLNMPRGKDDWFEVIDAMTKDYYLQLNNSMPTKAQAWARLCENPPTGYGITANKDNLSITMIGIVKPFNKRSFDRRWAKYTAKSSQL